MGKDIDGTVSLNASVKLALMREMRARERRPQACGGMKDAYQKQYSLGSMGISKPLLIKI